MRTRSGAPHWTLGAIAVATILAVAAGSVNAQRGRLMALEDQPGYIPEPGDKRLSAGFQRQVVFYRTHEAPGTIIVDTAKVVVRQRPEV
jgi:lipoprotein-anchoring transpeptidase ErfK/SrfK